MFLLILVIKKMLKHLSGYLFLHFLQYLRYKSLYNLTKKCATQIKKALTSP